MKRLLLAGLATGALALAAPAWAQTAEPVPATPPIVQPEAEPEVTAEEQLGVGVQAQPVLAAPPAQAAAQPAQTPAQPAEAMVATSENSGAVCQPRVTSVHFGRSAALSLQNRNAIEYAVDAASVCNLEQVLIADSAEGRTSSRRTEAVRAALIERGVPQDRIVVADAANAEGAGTGQLDVRMTFAGVATSGSVAAATAAPAADSSKGPDEALPATPPAATTEEPSEDEAEAASPVT